MCWCGILLSESLWNYLSDSVIYGGGLTGFKVTANASIIGLIFSIPFCLPLSQISHPSLYGLILWGWGLRTDRISITLS